MKRFFQIMRRHKIISVMVILILVGGGYWLYKNNTQSQGETRYVLAAVEKGTLISSVSGSGQISAANQIDLKPKASGDITYLNMTKGQEVKAGAFLAQIDTSDAQKSVRDAQVSLDSAKLSLEKLKKPASQLSLMQAEDALVAAREAKQKAQDDLSKSYEDSFNNVSSAFLDLPDIVNGINDILFDDKLSTGQWNLDYMVDTAKKYDFKATDYRTETLSKYQTARAAYDANFQDYKAVNRSSDTDTIESLVNETYETVRDVADAVKSVINLIQFYEDKISIDGLKAPAAVDTYLTNLNSYTGKTNTQLSSLLSIKNTITADKKAITDSDRTIAEKTESLAQVQAGADDLDIQAQQMTIKQRENALADAREKLADYSVRAPIDGVIAAVNVKKGDAASSGTALGTIITKQHLAEISLNEVDMSKVKVGQKATLTFDAIDGLELTGQVADIDALGTVSQGVVTYNVKIAFDAQDARVKPSMSVSAAIITEVKQGVLLVPNSAIKSADSSNYVEKIDAVATNQNVAGAGVTSASAPQPTTVQIGSANDSYTEITGGLNEGDRIVVRTITASTKSTAQTGVSLFQTGNARTGARTGVTGGGQDIFFRN